MKKQPKLTHIQELDARLQELNRKRLQAYRAGVSANIIDQLNRMIDETQLDLYTESELERNRNQAKDDGEDFIV